MTFNTIMGIIMVLVLIIGMPLLFWYFGDKQEKRYMRRLEKMITNAINNSDLNK